MEFSNASISLTSSSPRTPIALSQLHTIRSITGAEFCPPSPPSPTAPYEKRYSRHNISIFRSANGEERPLHSNEQPIFDDVPNLCKPRISSVTDSSHASPEQTHHDLLSSPPIPLRTCLPDVVVPPIRPHIIDDDDCASTYSHASAVNLDDLDDDDLTGLRLYTSATHAPHSKSTVISPHALEIRRQSFAKSFTKARQAKNRKAVILSRPELQPHNQCLTLMERCIRALTETQDMNLTYAKLTLDKFQTFSSLYTKDERLVVSELLKEAAMRLRHEAPTPWRSPIWEEPEQSRVWPPTAHCHHSQSNYQIANVFKGAFARRLDKSVVSDAMVRSVVYGSHIIPGAQTAESILLRMAGEYQREEVNRKASRAERIDVPLSFAMTLTAVLATFARLECSTSFKRYASRSASKRRSNPHASIMLKTKYDGVKLSFWITLHGEAPCTVLFRRPRIFSLRKIEDYATLATEAKDILAQFGRDVVGCKD